MINPIRKLITESYDYIDPENLFIINKGNILNNRDDVATAPFKASFVADPGAPSSSAEFGVYGVGGESTSPQMNSNAGRPGAILILEDKLS